MKNQVISSFSEGFKDSFRLSTSLVASVASTISAFANHNQGDGPKDLDVMKAKKSIQAIKDKTPKKYKTR